MNANAVSNKKVVIPLLKSTPVGKSLTLVMAPFIGADQFILFYKYELPKVPTLEVRVLVYPLLIHILQ